MKGSQATFLSRGACFLKFILQGVWINRFQLFLTTLTMSIGSLGLALTIFLGEGALEVLWADLENLLGSWTIIAPDDGPGGDLLRTRLSYAFTEDDLAELEKALPMARMVTPAVLDLPVEIMARSNEYEAQLDAVTRELAREEIFRPLKGRELSEAAFLGLKRECLVTDRMMEELGLDLDEANTILINGHPFQVVGIMAVPPMQGDRFPVRVLVSYQTARTLWLAPGSVGLIIVAWHHTEDMHEILGVIQRTLDRVRGPQTYYMSSKQFQIESGRKIVKTFIVVGLTQSIFCIFIASIGVLNVMLTNVSRRTHEFAIRVAMGARTRDILLVVLAESLCIGLLGALIGLVAAISAAPFIGELMARGIEEAAQLRPEITVLGIIEPLLICGACSLVAGIIPALKVKNVDILSALKKNV